MLPKHERSLVRTLEQRLAEPRRFMQVIVGPRQTGKTTILRQLIEKLSCPTHFVRASQDIAHSKDWLRREWEEARRLARQDSYTASNAAAHAGTSTSRPPKDTVLIVDEIQMVSQWSSTVKALWDEDTDQGLHLQVVLTGSSSLLLTKGLQEALTGRFELHFCEQWDYSECKAVFGYSLDEYLYFGGYPGAAPLITDNQRWLNYMHNSIIAPSLTKDVIALENIHKPAVMQALFTLGAAYSGQEISYRKLLGQLDDAGNATTVANYLFLLSTAGLLSGLQKYSEKLLKTRSSSPRLIVHDTSLMVASYGQYRDFLLTDHDRRGHLTESAVGAYLVKRGKIEGFEVFWWREGTAEVDFILQNGRDLTAIEVKSGRIKNTQGLDVFASKYACTHSLVVGSGNAPLEAFLQGEVALF